MNIIPPPYELPIPQDFHKNNRTRFLTSFKKNLDQIAQTLILFRGAEKISKHDDDQEYRVEQENSFFYLFGVKELGFYCALAPDTGKTYLFAHKYPESYKMWMVVKSNDELKQLYNVDAVYYVEELEGFLHSYSPQKIYYYTGVDTFSGISLPIPDFSFLKKYESDYTETHWILNECRMIKSEQEVEILKFICMRSSEAHQQVMKQIRNGNKEYQIEALFKYHLFVNNGCRFVAYECICASGRDAATLHYEENSKTISDAQLILNDMGGKYYGYCSDITVTFPSNGVFNEKQKKIYNAVLDAQTQVFLALKVGVLWSDMQLLAERVIVQHLRDAYIVKGEMDDLMKNRVGRLFFPHGLGHFMGLRTHDVEGRQKLSQRRLEAGMVFTNEPGCYFIDFALEKAYDNPQYKPYLVREMIEEYMEVGGVRLEDDIILYSYGPVILNKVPRSIQQVEACMRGEDWSKYK